MSKSSKSSVQTFLEDQRQRWQRGERVKVETYLSQQPELGNNDDALLDLIYHEMVLREASGEKLRLEEYLERFPKIAEQLRLQFQLHQALEDEEPTLPRVDGHLKTVPPMQETHRSGGPRDGTPPRPNIPGYDILETIGQGGMGVVYKARHLRLNRLVALKMIRGDRSRERHEQALKEMLRFRLEAEAVAQLKHPNVVQIHEFGEIDGQPYFSLELVEAGNLHQKASNRPMPPLEAALLTETLARAVHFAHLQGIIHRDLKPANVLLDKDGTPKITDFGLAKFVKSDEQQTKTEEILGTPAYMAPEQADRTGAPITPAVDVYALGAILYQLLTGKPPFCGEDWMQTLLMVVNDEPKPPRQLEPRIPLDLETICLKCLAKEPQQRYSSAEALADDLKRFRLNEPIHARPVTVRTRLVKWTRRHPALAALGSIAALLAVAAVVGGFWIQHERTERFKERSRAAELVAQQAEEKAQLAKEKADRDAHLVRVVTDALNRASLLLGQARSQTGGDLGLLKEALAEVANAEAAMAAGEPNPGLQTRAAELRRNLEAALAFARSFNSDRELVEKLRRIRAGRIHVLAAADEGDKGGGRKQSDKTKPVGGSRVDPASIDREYARLFAEAGIDIDALEVPEAAGIVQKRAIVDELLHAIDHWSRVRRAAGGKADKLLRIAIAADKDEYRNGMRQAILAVHVDYLCSLAEKVALPAASSSTVVLLAGYLDEFGKTETAVALLRRAALHYADDFWVHFDLAECLTRTSPPQWQESIRHFYCALALDRHNVDVVSKLGWVAYRSENYDLAEKSLRRALEIDKEHYNSHYRLGLVLAALKNYDAAIASFKESLRINAKGENAWSELGYVYNAKEKYEDAAQAFRQALELDPEHPAALFGLGFALTELGHYPEAIEAYKKRLALKPFNIDAQYNLGIAYLRNKEFDNAIRAFEIVKRENPKDPSAERMIELARQGKSSALDDAIKALKDKVAKDPKDHKAIVELGRAYFDQGMYDKAAAEYERAILIEPNIPEYYIDLARALYRLREYAAVIGNCNKALELKKDAIDAYFLRGNARYELGKFQDAADDFTEAIRIKPKSALYYNERGFCYLRLSKEGPAIADFTRATELEPLSAVYFNNLGWALGGFGRIQEAIEALKEAVKRDPEYFNAHANLGWSYNELRDWDNAIKSLKKAIELNPASHISRYNLAWAYNEKKEYAEALKQLDEAIRLNKEYAHAYKLRSKVHRALGNDKQADKDYNEAVRLDPRLSDRSSTPEGL